MRRWVRQLLPVMVIALMVQFFAPVGAIWTVAAALADPLAASAICSESGVAHDQGNSGSQSHHQSCCPLCYVAHGGPALPGADAAHGVDVVRQSCAIVWRDSGPATRIHRSASHAQARAPPIVLI